MQAVFSAIIKSQVSLSLKLNRSRHAINNVQDAPPGELEGADVLEWFTIIPEDFQSGSDQDFCAEGADAYTSNRPPNNDIPEPWSITYFCDAAFGDEDNLQPPTLDDIDCENFKLTNDQGEKKYRITNEMEPIAATMLHEMMHFNSIGREAGLTEVSFPSFQREFGTMLDIVF